GVRTLKRGPTVGRVIGLFSLTVASGLTQGRGLALVPALLALLAIVVVRHRLPLVRYAAWSAAGLAATVAAYEVYRRGFSSGAGGAFGGEANAGKALDVGGFISQAWQFYLPKLSFMADRIGPSYGYRQMFIETFYGTFGSLDIVFRPRVMDAL